MKGLVEITNIIARQMGAVARQVTEDYDIVICPERAFLDDYLPRVEEYYEKQTEMESLDSDSPTDLPYQKTIFVVIKVGSGIRNMGISNSDVTLECLTEENDFEVTRAILDAFLEEYNFEYRDGMLQSYFNPEIGSSMDAVHTGFRAMYHCRGNIRIPVDGLVFVQDALVSFSPSDSENVEWVELPYLSLAYSSDATADPQAFSGQLGRTANLNRQTIQTISMTSYLFYDPNARSRNDTLMNEFSLAVIRSQMKMNRKFRLALRTNVTDPSEVEIKGERRLCIANDWFTLSNATYEQDLGDASPWSLVFSRALEKEEGE